MFLPSKQFKIDINTYFKQSELTKSNTDLTNLFTISKNILLNLNLRQNENSLPFSFKR